MIKLILGQKMLLFMRTFRGELKSSMKRLKFRN